MGNKPKKEEGGGTEHCKCEGCKQTQSRFTFCANHYEWFKFGLITKEGKKVGDFEKKWGHFEAYTERQKTYKAA
ncbi:MAG: hypothetical protein JST80_08035 [Bdellovibrionales bacterium]|nr:hypothetical protein [Bdellovibrionales bacterium]